MTMVTFVTLSALKFKVGSERRDGLSPEEDEDVDIPDLCFCRRDSRECVFSNSASSVYTLTEDSDVLSGSEPLLVEPRLARKRERKKRLVKKIRRRRRKTLRLLSLTVHTQIYM